MHTPTSRHTPAHLLVHAGIGSDLDLLRHVGGRELGRGEGQDDGLDGLAGLAAEEACRTDFGNGLNGWAVVGAGGWFRVHDGFLVGGEMCSSATKPSLGQAVVKLAQRQF